jgi:hypothetical protein
LPAQRSSEPRIERTAHREDRMPTPFVVTRQNRPASLKIVGEEITVLASGAQTGGYEGETRQAMPLPGPVKAI